MEKEIQIPDGFEAKIEGNKVIFVPKESEDERIRNEILLYIGSKQDIDLDTHNRWCAYLEKQKKQKPAEWSEEDEKMLHHIIIDIESLKEQDYCKPLCDEEINWLKHLSPQSHWKPSEEQMEALSDAWLACDDKEKCELLSSLYDELKNL